MSFDASQLWGNDLTLDGGGSPLMVDSTTKGEQRVYRRLMTNPGDYIWHPNYGAGLPRYVGQNLHLDEIEGLIRQQLALEVVVAPQPIPNITLSPILNGVFVSLKWVDNVTGEQAVLQFDLTNSKG